MDRTYVGTGRSNFYHEFALVHCLPNQVYFTINLRETCGFPTGGTHDGGSNPADTDSRSALDRPLGRRRHKNKSYQRIWWY